jgi:quinol monooxygenase YgiN
MEHYTSGDWQVIEGKEDEFTEGWQSWLEWTRAEAPGLITARLLRDAQDPHHFVSWALWQDAASREAWWGKPGFSERMAALRAMCEEFRGGNYDMAVAVGETIAAKAA